MRAPSALGQFNFMGVIAYRTMNRYAHIAVVSSMVAKAALNDHSRNLNQYHSNLNEP